MRDGPSISIAADSAASFSSQNRFRASAVIAVQRAVCSAHRPPTRERLAAMGPWARSSCWALWALCALAGGRELDPAACAVRFDVQRNKIIRTEESREMGARYLSELDVGARAECLRLCCETDACDVFVFEEKVECRCLSVMCHIVSASLRTTHITWSRARQNKMEVV